MHTRRNLLAAAVSLPVLGQATWFKAAAQEVTLRTARQGFKTKLFRRVHNVSGFDAPPSKEFALIKYDAPSGKLGAYRTTPKASGRSPAMIWITGGDCNSISDVWSRAPRSNDQTARAYRDAGIAMMFPSLRGGNSNPGIQESFLGELDDIEAAFHFIETQPDIDPERIYLGGHSTGGTMALLAAEYTDLFRAFFCFGPVDDARLHNDARLHFDQKDETESKMRAPGRWLHSVSKPTFVFEGSTREVSRTEEVQRLAVAAKGTKAQTFIVPGADHFTVLAPINELIATKIVADTGPVCSIAFQLPEVAAAFAKG